MNGFRQTLSQCIPWLLILLAFVLPLSTSLVSVVTVALGVCWLLEGRFQEKWNEVVANPLCLAVFLYVGMLVLGLGWSENVGEGVAVIRKHWKIMVFPVLLTAVRWDWRRRTVGAFIAGVSVVMVLNLLDRAQVFSALGLETISQTTLLTNHIIYTPMLAFAAYLVAHTILWDNELNYGRRRWLAALGGLMSCTVFLTNGRMGQLAFFVLLALLMWQYFHRNRWRAVLLSLTAFVLIFTDAYTLSPQFQLRMNAVRHEIATLEDNPETPVGLRLTWWQNAWVIVRQSPWFGVGTGDFTSAYAAVHRERTPHVSVADNPHNQYLYAAIRLGVFGVVGLLGMFVVQLFWGNRSQDGWERMRTAFPLFFLTIMLTDSYLVSHGSGFLFSLFCAVLYKKSPGATCCSDHAQANQDAKRYWLIFSYRVNIPGSACAQHIDDRLPLLEQAGITPIVLSGPLGERLTGYRHYQAWSLAPSGLRFELRHYLKHHLPHRWQFNVAEILLFPLLPFYLLEKLIINLESEWSWFLGAAVRGFFLRRRYRPEVLYSTGGSASAHLAALLLGKDAEMKWIAETQDPLVHDDWSRSQRVLGLYKWLEKRIARKSDAFVFLTRQAMENARSRAGEPFPGAVVYPGATMRQVGFHFTKGEVCRFAHFGSLAGTRNLVVFLEELHQLLQDQPDMAQRMRLDLYGSLDATSKQSIDNLGLHAFVIHHGLVDRQKALLAMDSVDCLLLIQNVSSFSSETIPSKVYEYFFSNRPILGLVYRNNELTAMLTAYSHFVAQADSVDEVKEQLLNILTLHSTTPLRWRMDQAAAYTTARAVSQLLALTDRNPDGCKGVAPT